MLVTTKVLREGEVRKGQFTTLTLVEKLKQNGLIFAADYDAGRRLGERGNTIMHKGLYEERMLPSLSLGFLEGIVCIADGLLPAAFGFCAVCVKRRGPIRCVI